MEDALPARAFMDFERDEDDNISECTAPTFAGDEHYDQDTDESLIRIKSLIRASDRTSQLKRRAPA